MLEKVILGITLAAPIGPVSAEMIKRGLNGGFVPAFTVRLGAAVGNTLCLLAAYLGLLLLIKNPMTMAVCGLLGSLFLIYMGLQTIFSGKKTFDLEKVAKAPSNTLNSLGIGFILSIANPIGIIFWMSIFPAAMDQAEFTASWFDFSYNLLIICGVLIWGVCLSLALAGGKRLLNNKLISLVTILAGCVILYFGAKYGYKALTTMSTNYGYESFTAVLNSLITVS